MRTTHLLWTRRPRSLRGRRATALRRVCSQTQRLRRRRPRGSTPARRVPAAARHEKSSSTGHVRAVTPVGPRSYCRGVTSLRIGAHVDQADPLAEAGARGADLAQFFLGDPQGWKGPTVAYAGGAAGLRADAAAAGVDLYVHAPYVINVATSNNRIRIPSRKLLAQHATLAAEVGASGLVVHGGHVLAGDDPETGFDNWAKTLERFEPPLPILVENTAGGGNAMARRLDRVARLWEVLDDRCDAATMARVGFCLDTCHAHAGRRGARRARRPGQGGHRPGGPGARQRLARRVRLGGRPAREPRRAARSRAPTSSPWCPPPARPSWSRPPAAPRVRAPTSPTCARASRADA